jgi:hypothetical protein
MYIPSRSMAVTIYHQPQLDWKKKMRALEFRSLMRSLSWSFQLRWYIQKAIVFGTTLGNASHQSTSRQSQKLAFSRSVQGIFCIHMNEYPGSVAGVRKDDQIQLATATFF